MPRTPQRSRLTEWLTALLLVPLMAGAGYLVMAWLIRPPATRPALVPPVTSLAFTVPTLVPDSSPFTAVNRWLHSGEAAPDPGAATVLTLATPANDIALPVTGAATGTSRADPFPRSTTATLANWDVRVLDNPLIRGELAWQILLETNQFNDPPASGYEYVLVPIWVQHKRLTLDEKSISIHLTGDRGVTHFSFDASVVAPEPALETYMPGRATSQGWAAFQVHEGEKNLMLVVDDGYLYEERIHYIALDEEAAIVIPEETLAAIPVNDIGSDPGTPATVGQTAVMADWQITIDEILRGEAAWQLLTEANPFNDRPPDGSEYRVLKVRVRYLGTDEGPHTILNSHFEVRDGMDVVHDFPSLMQPEPNLFYDIFPGGEATGWMTVQVPEDDASAVLIFWPDRSRGEDEGADIRYFLLLGNGR